MYVRQLKTILKPFPAAETAIVASCTCNPFGISLFLLQKIKTHLASHKILLLEFFFGDRFFRNIYTHQLNSEDRNRAKEDNKNFKKQIRLRIILCYFFHSKSGFDLFSDWSIQFLILESDLQKLTI